MKGKRNTKYKTIPLLLILLPLCFVLISPHNLFANDVSAPGSKIPPEQWEKKPPKRKPPLPSQIVGISPSPTKVFSLSPLDVETLIQEDKAMGKDRPLRAGIHRAVNASPQTHGEWYDIDDGKGSIWLFQIHAMSASGIRVHFTDFNIPKNARVYVYSPLQPDKYSGPYKWGPDFWTRIVSDDTVIIELAIPTPYSPGAKPPFIIKEVSHMYRHIRPQSKLDSGISPLAGPCHNDATCYPAWASEGDAVGRIVIDLGGSTGYCTGTMLDSLTADHTPYFLTANHCIDENTDLSNVDVYWFYETSTCNGSSPDMYLMPNSNDAVFFAGKDQSDFSDFTLLELLGTVPRTLTWTGWTVAEPDIGDDVTGIHHPGLPTDDHRRISFGIVDTASDNYWDILWNSGSTEGGSSGSCIWNLTGQCTGQLRGGTASCSNPQGTDEYGKFSVSYPFMQSYLQGGSDDSLEDNDSRASAKSLSDGVYKSNVVKLSDEDWYSVTVPDNTLISVDLTFIHNNGDINIELYRGSDTTPVSTSTGTGDSEHVEHLNTGGSINYFFRVFLSDDTRNTYNMKISVGASSSSLWIKNYGDFGGIAYDIETTSDNGFIVAGELYGDSWIFKLDAAGAIQWQKTYDYNYYSEEAKSVQQTTDGGYIVAGDLQTSSYTYYARVFKLDSNGNIQWENVYGSSSDDDFGREIHQTSDGYILLGTTYSYGAGSGDFWLLKLDTNGNIQWQKTYGGSGYEEAYSLYLTTDSGYIVAGYTSTFGAGSADFLIIKLDGNGNVQWQKSYGGGSQDVAHAIQQTADSGFIVAGETYSYGSGSSDFFVLKLDANGSVLWQKAFGTSNGDIAYSVMQTADGGYVVAGETYSFTSYEYDALMLKLDLNGNIVWQKDYGDNNYGDDDSIYSLHELTSNEIIATGKSTSFSTANSWALKLDSSGNLDTCSTIGTPSVATVTSSVFVTTTSGATQTSSTSPITAAQTIIDADAITNDICYADVSAPEIFVYPSSVDFGYVNLSPSSSSRRLRIKNSGNANLTITAINISGTDASHFSQTNDCSTVAVNSSCSIDIIFSPTSAGTKSATLTISSDDPDMSTFDIPLTGTGGNILVVTESGSGNGTVTSSPSGIDTGNDYIEAYAPGTVVTLTAVADAGSVFIGWSWGGCSGTGDCTVTMNADTTVTARFELCTDPPVRIDGATPIYYSTLQEAYDAAADGDTIQSQASRFIENLNINRNISISLEGGYDCSYSTITDKTRIQGDMTISDGMATIENIMLEQQN